MASLLPFSSFTTFALQNKVKSVRQSGLLDAFSPFCGMSKNPNCRGYPRFSLIKASTSSVEGGVLEKEPSPNSEEKIDYGVVDLHHVGVLCKNLERSIHFYQNVLGFYHNIRVFGKQGLEINEARPDDKLPYRGAWLWVGSGMIHLMELPNPDPLTGRPQHGGRDRHTCISIKDVSKLKTILDREGNRSGRPAIFTRDPDANALEFTQVDV
ncbi:hypothetical protein V2J09_002884 [Rumex salicifolius]